MIWSRATVAPHSAQKEYQESIKSSQSIKKIASVHTWFLFNWNSQIVDYLRYLWIYITRKLTLPLVLSSSFNIKYETRHPLIRKKVSTLTNALLTAWNSNLWLRPKRVATFDVGKPWPNKPPRMWPIITHVMERNLIPSKQDRWSPLGGFVLKSLFVLAYNPKFKNNVSVSENTYNCT